MAPRRRARRTTGSIRRLPSGRYQARVRLEDGGLLPAPETFTTKTAADRWLASVIADQAQQLDDLFDDAERAFSQSRCLHLDW